MKPVGVEEKEKNGEKRRIGDRRCPRSRAKLIAV